MNRTHLILASVAALSLVAVVGRRAAPPHHPKAILAPPTVVVTPTVRAAPLAPTTVTAGPLIMTGLLSNAQVMPGTVALDVKLDVSARGSVPEAKRVPVNLAVAIDHSGSMAGAKMEQTRAAARELLGQLQPGDRLSIISFSNAVEVFPSSPINPDTVRRARAFIDGIVDVGATNISDALYESYAQLRDHSREYKVSRVVLLSDGVPTMGVTDPAVLVQIVDSGRELSISTSAYGVGFDFNAGLMRDLASHGAGTYAFIENVEKTGLAFATELSDATKLLAREVQVELVPAPGFIIKDVPGHVLTRSGSAVTVKLYDFTPGQTAQMLVRLEGKVDGQGTVLLATSKLSAIDVAEDLAVSGALPLEVGVTQDAVAVAASKSLEVDEMGKKVDISVQLAEASHAYESGDSAHALNLLANVRRMFGPSADALSGEDLGSVESSWKAGGAQANAADMKLTKKTMKNFGMNNTSQY